MAHFYELMDELMFLLILPYESGGLTLECHTVILKYRYPDGQQTIMGKSSYGFMRK